MPLVRPPLVSRAALATLATLGCAACGSHAPQVPAAPAASSIEASPPAPAPVATTAPVSRPPVAPDAATTFLARCRSSLEDARTQQALLLGTTGPHTIANTLEPFNEMSRVLSNAAALASLLEEVHPDAAVRDAARTCEAEVSRLSTSLLLDKVMYETLAGVDVKAADAATQRFAMTTLRDYRRAGVALDDAGRARIQAIADELTTLGQTFSKAIAEDTRSIVVTDPKRLAGLPADWIADHKPDAKGAVTITTDYPDYIPFITYAEDDALRKELYIAFRSRGDAHNEATLQRVLTLRAEEAKLLGFPNWAAYQSDDKMLRGDKAAAAFIERITRLARARGKRDYAQLLAQLEKHDPKARAVGDWQKAYLENQIKREQYAVDETEVRKYFPYDQTLAGLLAITAEMYDIQYQRVTDAQDPKPWHPDVEVYDVVRGTTKLGRIYLDMHPRADKYKHAAQFSIQSGVAGKQLPEGALVCNLPTGSQLMDHGDAVTMFHEFGHLMHHVLGGQQHWIAQSGVATEQDFVEAPSQMFEEWGWSYETLSRFAKQPGTGTVISKPLVDAMRRADKFGIGTDTLQQMFYAAIALEFHRTDPAKLDQLATVKRLQAKYTPFAYVDGTKFHTSFGHLIGYSSMYYTYMWSLVIAKDLLTPFQKQGLMNPAVTHRYRDAILAAGGTKPAADLVADFLGRKYDFKAFERYLAN